MRDTRAFTLVELVVVILILGILAGVAAPKLFNTSSEATDNGLRQTLAIVRDAIELYTAKNGEMPECSDDGTGVGNFHEQLAPYLRGTFPVCPVGAENNLVGVGSADPLEGVEDPTTGWLYNNTTGEFICNYSAATASDSALSYDEL